MTGRVNRARSLARGVDPLVGPDAFDVENNGCWYLGRTVPMQVFYDFGYTEEAFVFDTWVFTDKLTAYSVENSEVTALDLLTKLLYLGLPCRHFSDYYFQRISAGSLTSDDVAVGISYSGESKDTRN